MGPEKLIDKKFNNFYHSTYTNNAWVQLELLNIGTVSKVRIFNRLDCCGDRLLNMEVRVGNNEVTVGNQSYITTNQLCGMYVGPGKNVKLLRSTVHIP